jgi:hypothetical protein
LRFINIHLFIRPLAIHSVVCIFSFVCVCVHVSMIDFLFVFFSILCLSVCMFVFYVLCFLFRQGDARLTNSIALQGQAAHGKGGLRFHLPQAPPPHISRRLRPLLATIQVRPPFASLMFVGSHALGRLSLDPPGVFESRAGLTSSLQLTDLS